MNLWQIFCSLLDVSAKKKEKTSKLVGRKDAKKREQVQKDGKTEGYKEG